MERYALKLREVCFLSVFLILCTFVNLYYYVEKSSWSTLVESEDPEAFSIPELLMVTEWPISNATLNQLLDNKKVTNVLPITVNKKFRLSEQIKSWMTNHGIDSGQNLSHKSFAVFVDLDKKAFSSIRKPYLFFQGSWEPYKIYINGRLIKESDARIQYLAPIPLESEPDKLRIVWLIENTRTDRISGLLLDSFSIRSEVSLNNSLALVGVRQQFPRIAASIFLLVIGIVGLALGIVAKNYIDIWAFAAFCFSISFLSWSFTPMYFLGYLQNPANLITIRAISSASIVFFAAVLSLSYFRFEGRHLRYGSLIDAKKTKSINEVIVTFIKSLCSPFRGTLFFTFGACVIILAFHPASPEGPLNRARTAEINALLVWVLIASQSAAFFFGFAGLIRLKKYLQTVGLAAQVVLIKRRLAQSLIFAASMFVMVVIYTVGFAGIANYYGSDAVVLGAVAPALVMLLMFFWMVTNAQNFLMKFSPRLAQIDREVMAFGEGALKKRYQGTLVVFDVAGMKQLNELRSSNHIYEIAVDTMISQIEHDLADLIQKGRTTFRYKSNGDEFIFAMWANDTLHAKLQFKELMALWFSHGEDLMKKWKSTLQQSLGDSIHLDIVENIDMHVMACTMNEIKITIKGGIDNPTASPDFLEPRFTRLSAIFKPSRWNKVAMLTDDADLLSAEYGVYSEMPGTDMGLWINKSDEEILNSAASS